MASIRKRGNTYQIRVSVGYDAKGNQRQKYKTWKPSEGMTERQIQKELERQTIMFEKQCQSGQCLEGNIRFSEFVDYWLREYAQKQLRPKTISGYTTLLKRINAAIGHIRLDKLQPYHLMEFYNNLREENIREDVRYTLKKDIAPLLKKKGITHKMLADMSGLSVNTVDSFIHGGNISEKSVMKISEALNMPADKIFKVSASQKKALAPKTISHYHRLISSILEKAVKWQIIMHNPCHRVDAPKVQKKETVCLDEFQTAELIKCLDSEPLQYKAMITLLLYSGMRRGELCGLEWSDVDFKHSLVDINKSSLYTPENGTYDDTTKTESSKRVIKVPPVVVELLKLHRKEQKAERLKLGDLWTDSGKIFTQHNGKPIHPDTVSAWFAKFLERHGLPRISLHGLRHTNATLLIAAGSDLRTVSKRLGHSNMSTTANIYTHAIQSADERAAQILDTILTQRG